ncbi:hotdog family protein [Paenibacillus tarimensis]|uniref:FabA-like domain protein n=1 Tax=Paenibacillus tarimensis TaxID=416012 RepID=UPI001F37EE35|nr:FabA-like domain protein [Paenibacillus tarimensis]MCF2945184.1 FabA-like domain protein [Paenibacillus tarimensis]
MSLLSSVMDLLPHEPPFRFVTQVTRYQSGECLYASHEFTWSESERMGGGEAVPEVCLLEGLAQTAVLFTQLETSPLEKWEFPLLGHVHAAVQGEAGWGTPVNYEVKMIRILAKRAVLSGSVYTSDGRTCLEATLTVAVASGREELYEEAAGCGVLSDVPEAVANDRPDSGNQGTEHQDD